MIRRTGTIPLILMAATLAGPFANSKDPPPASRPSGEANRTISEESLIQCANLIYDRDKTSVCFADRFLKQIGRETSIRTEDKFRQVRMESDVLFRYPFAIMTGEGAFQLTAEQRKNLRAYLQRGGFLLASSGCSNNPWNRSFRDELKTLFPDQELKKLPMTHPVFHTVYDIDALKIKKDALAGLEGMELNGRLVMIYSEQGLNDTSNAGKGCCCCGGSEILNAQAVNVNILAYALTH